MPPDRRRGGSLIMVALFASLAGCATVKVQPAPLSAEAGAERYAARSLDDPALHAFLRDNLGRDPTTWDFEALCWVGFFYHPSLEVARAQWATARAAERTAGQRQNPSLTLTPGYNFTRDAGLSPWMPGVSMDFLLPTAGKRSHQQEIAAADAEAARLAVFSAAWQMRSELRQALLATAGADRRERVLRAQAETHRRVVALLEQRFTAGAISASEVSANRSALLRSEAAADEAAGQAATARARVAAALGLPLAAVRGLALPVPATSAPLAAADLTAARRQSLRNRTDVLAALAKYRSAQAALDLELSRQWPDIHLGPGYQWDQGQNKWTLGLTVELPVFHRNEGPIAEAVAKRSEAAAQFNLTQGQAVSAIDAAEAAWTAAQAQLEHSRRLGAEATRQAELAQQRRELGAGDAVEVESARSDAAVAATATVEAENAVALAAGQLEDALQIPFPKAAALAAPAPHSVSPLP